MSIESFMKKFQYDQSKVGHVGVERESFVCHTPQTIVPEAHRIIEKIPGFEVEEKYPWGTKVHKIPKDAFGFELSACQIESRIGPCTLDRVAHELVHNRWLLNKLVQECDLSITDIEVAPEDMPLDVYPDPTGRYQKITRNMPKDVLLAACRIAGTHIHVGMENHESALHTYNFVIRYTDDLCEMGNGSFGERLAIYNKMAPNYRPPPYKNWNAYYQDAKGKGFENDPRKCWALIRISTHGTIEFRMFGATASTQRIVGWAKHCKTLCQMALAEA